MTAKPVYIKDISKKIINLSDGQTVSLVFGDAKAKVTRLGNSQYIQPEDSNSSIRINGKMIKDQEPFLMNDILGVGEMEIALKPLTNKPLDDNSSIKDNASTSTVPPDFINESTNSQEQKVESNDFLVPPVVPPALNNAANTSFPSNDFHTNEINHTFVELQKPFEIHDDFALILNEIIKQNDIAADSDEIESRRWIYILYCVLISIILIILCCIAIAYSYLPKEKTTPQTPEKVEQSDVDSNNNPDTNQNADPDVDPALDPNTSPDVDSDVDSDADKNNDVDKIIGDEESQYEIWKKAIGDTVPLDRRENQANAYANAYIGLCIEKHRQMQKVSYMVRAEAYIQCLKHDDQAIYNDDTIQAMIKRFENFKSLIDDYDSIISHYFDEIQKGKSFDEIHQEEQVLTDNDNSDLTDDSNSTDDSDLTEKPDLTNDSDSTENSDLTDDPDLIDNTDSDNIMDIEQYDENGELIQNELPFEKEVILYMIRNEEWKTSQLEDYNDPIWKVFANYVQTEESLSDNCYKFEIKEQGESEHYREGKVAGEKASITILGVEYIFRWVPPMPASDSTGNNEPNRGFWIMDSEITQNMWSRMMNSSIIDQRKKDYHITYGYGKGNKRPMYCVNFDECQYFCENVNRFFLKSSEKSEKYTSFRLLPEHSFRLPTEQEWKFAIYAGLMEPDKLEKNDEDFENMKNAQGVENTKYPEDDILSSKEISFPPNVRQGVPNSWKIYQTPHFYEWCVDKENKGTTINGRNEKSPNYKNDCVGFRLVLQ